MKAYVSAIGNSYGEVLFISRPWVGVVLFGLSWFHPNMAIMGLVSVLASYLFARAIGLKKGFLNSGFYTYNPLLIGFAIGRVFELGPLSLFFTLIAAVVTFALTIVLNHFFYTFFKLPILSLPFVLAGSLVFLASRKYSGLFVGYFYPSNVPGFELNLPFWLMGYFESLGAVFFIPQALFGLVLAVSVAAVSRILFLLSFSGYYLGTLITGLMTGSMMQSFADHNHFNYILIAMALGGVFLIPSVKSYLMAMVAVAVSTLFVDSVELIWASFGIPAFPLPFVIVTLLFLYILGLLDHPLIPSQIKETPERTLDLHLTLKRRFPFLGPVMDLPFSGVWQVWQGFDGKWTHQGIWSNAFDFVITDTKGKTFQGSGEELEDYYAYKKPVLAPVSGRVVGAEGSKPDCPIGEPEAPGNWGNHLIIRTEEGVFVEISHLAQDSVKFKTGDWVISGQAIGLCGNSGYSPQPHIHLQVQVEESIGAQTRPFCLGNYRLNGLFCHQGRPVEGDKLEALPKSRALTRKTAFSLGQSFRYKAQVGDKTEEVTWTVEMTADGVSCLVSKQGRLFFGRPQNGFFVYSVEGSDPYLTALFQALPRLPLYEDDQLVYQDNLNLETFFSPLTKDSLLLASSFFGPVAEVVGTYQFNGLNEIAGTINSGWGLKATQTRVVLDQTLGFQVVESGKIRLELLESKSFSMTSEPAAI